MLLSERDTGFLRCSVPLRTGWDLDKLLDGWGVCSPRFVCDGSAEGGEGGAKQAVGGRSVLQQAVQLGRQQGQVGAASPPASSLLRGSAVLAATCGPSSVHRTRPHWEALGASRDPVPWKMMPQKHETRTQNCEACVWMRSYMEY